MATLRLESEFGWVFIWEEEEHRGYWADLQSSKRPILYTRLTLDDILAIPSMNLVSSTEDFQLEGGW